MIDISRGKPFFIPIFSSIPVFMLIFDGKINNTIKYTCFVNIFLMILLIIFLAINFKNGKILNFASFVLIPFYVNMILLNINYNIIKLGYFDNMLIRIINGFIGITYSLIISMPSGLISLINLSDELNSYLVIYFGTTIVNIIIKAIIDLKVNNFKIDKDKEIIKILSYIQCGGYLSLYYLMRSFYSSMK
jgi:hypothetical protein